MGEKSKTTGSRRGALRKILADRLNTNPGELKWRKPEVESVISPVDRKRRHLTFAAVGSMTGGLLAACGGGGSDSDAGGAPPVAGTTSGPPVTAGPPMTIPPTTSPPLTLGP